MNPRNVSSNSVNKNYKHGSITLIKSLREEMILVELQRYIELTSAVRRAQKAYYRERNIERKKTLLIECKQLESRQEKEGNRLWLAYKFKRSY